jgi:phosphotransferase system enzyme I (PtsI)
MVITMDTTKKDAKIIAGLKLTVDLAKIFLGEKRGTEEEIKNLSRLKEALGDKIYSELVYLFTNTLIEDSDKAKELIENIKQHNSTLKKLLGRDAGIHVAALDYMQNRANFVNNPTFIESKKIKKIAEKAITDDYLQVYDKTMFCSNIEDEIARTCRYGSCFSIIILDIDDFKEINDSYGHVTGDKVLKKVVDTVKNNIRRTDSVYRYGGDEFVVLLPETASLGTERIAVKILKLCKKSKIPGERAFIKVSMGITTLDKVNNRDKKQILRDVDYALYKAKRSGKNKIFKNTAGGCEEVHIEEKNFKKALIKSTKRFILSGVPVSPGISAGRAFHYRDILSREVDLNNLAEEEIDGELSRVQKAIKKVRKDLMMMQKRVGNDISEEHAGIFKTHQTMLQDDTLIHEIEDELKKRMINAEHIVKDVFNRWERRFKSADADFIKEKSYDIADIGKQVFLALQGFEADVLANVPQDSVIFARRLLTSDTIHLNKKKTRAVVTEEGSKNSHSALLSRAMNIPSIVRIKTSEDGIPNGTTVIVNGDRGDVIVNPNRKELELVKKKGSTVKKYKQAGFCAEGIKINGKPIKVYANIASPEDARIASLSMCDGIGLFRIEQIYMTSNILPDTNCLIDRLSKSLKYMKDRVNTIRLLDIGKDKTLPYLHVHEEQNSALGLGGIRLLLRYPGLLETQLAALLKLSNQYSIRILVPMVSLPEEMVQVRKVLENEKIKLIKNGIKYKSDIQLGVMIEIPSSVITIDEIIEYSDFLSIGTNDLIQYTMAADREKLALSEYYDAGAEIILESIKVVLEKAKNTGLDCGICGELAGNLEYTERLIELGLQNFSVSPHIVRSVQEKLIDMSKNDS